MCSAHGRECLCFSRDVSTRCMLQMSVFHILNLFNEMLLGALLLMQ